jgi:hypothetical protein
MNELMALTVVGGMIAFFIWGLLNPGAVKYKGSRTPVPPEALFGGLIFGTMCGVLLALKLMDQLNTILLIVVIGVAVCGWIFAALASMRDARKRK